MLGLYPTWFEPGVGSGWVIALIATIHVLFSHASVGSAILFAFLARRAVTHNRPEYFTFIRRYGIFLMIFSYVLGSVTGPGIWFSATIANPRGLSALIHNFVWLWATEWVFFLIEIVGVYLLVYLAGRVAKETYLRLTAIFALSSVATLLVITGVLSFMLMPGVPSWYETGSVLQAFFGENTMAQVFVRVFFMLTITGVVGGIVAGGIKDAAEKAVVSRALSAVGIFGTIAGSLCFFWYMQTVPETTDLIIRTRVPESFATMLYAFAGGSIVYFLVMAAVPNLLKSSIVAVATVVILVVGLAPEEMAREIIRKPWVAGQFIYSNQLIGRDVPGLGLKSELPAVAEKGILAQHPFVPEHLRKVTPENRVEAGRVLTLTTCSGCHSLSATGMRPLKNFFAADATAKDIETYLGAGLFRGHTVYMPPLPLPQAEREAMAAYIEAMLKSSDPAALAVKGAAAVK